MTVFTIVLDSLPGTATEDHLGEIEASLTRAASLGDVWVGIDRKGVVTVSADIEARAFADAVEIARRELPATLAAAGLHFEIDLRSIPTG